MCTSLAPRDVTLGQVADAINTERDSEEQLRPMKRSIINQHRAAILVGTDTV